MKRGKDAGNKKLTWGVFSQTLLNIDVLSRCIASIQLHKRVYQVPHRKATPIGCYKIALKIYPMIIIPTIVIPKNNARSCHRMTLLKIIDSGIEIVTIAVINDKAVPSGTPLPTSASMTGITLTEFA